MLDQPKRLGATVDERKGLKSVNNRVTVEVKGTDSTTGTPVCSLANFEEGCIEGSARKCGECQRTTQGLEAG